MATVGVYQFIFVASSDLRNTGSNLTETCMLLHTTFFGFGVVDAFIDFFEN
jgi:hypothetical protein